MDRVLLTAGGIPLSDAYWSTAGNGEIHLLRGGVRIGDIFRIHDLLVGKITTVTVYRSDGTGVYGDRILSAGDIAPFPPRSEYIRLGSRSFAHGVSLGQVGTNVFISWVQYYEGSKLDPHSKLVMGYAGRVKSVSISPDREITGATVRVFHSRGALPAAEVTTATAIGVHQTRTFDFTGEATDFAADSDIEISLVLTFSGGTAQVAGTVVLEHN